MVTTLYLFFIKRQIAKNQDIDLSFLEILEKRKNPSITFRNVEGPLQKSILAVEEKY